MALRRRDELAVREGVDLGRMAKRGAGSALYTLSVLAAVVLVITVSMRFRQQWDFSELRQNSLSPQTVEVLESLDEPVFIHALYRDKEPRRADYWVLLQMFRDASSQVRAEFIDPVAKPGRVAALGLNPEEGGGQRDGVTVVSRGERRMVFRGSSEEDVTNAILEVGSVQSRVVGFIRGYGELDPASTLQSGLSRAADALRSEYYDVRDVFLSDGIPGDVTALVAAGIRKKIPDADLEVLAEWLENGGRLLALVDAGQDPGLEALLARWGLGATDFQVLAGPDERVRNNPEFIKVTEYSDHPVVRSFGKNYPAAFPVVRAVENFEPTDHEVFHQPLASSGAFSLGIDPDGRREQGPFSIAVASWKRHGEVHDEEEDRETRILLVGDVDFANNVYLAAQSNRNFFLNCVGWLSRESRLVAVRRHRLAGQRIEMTADEERWVSVITFAAPALVVLGGIVVSLRRRRL